MDAGRVDQLLSRARAVIGVDHADQVVAEIDRTLSEAGADPVVAGRLHLARAIALQDGPDPYDAAAAALRAVMLLRRTDRPAAQAYAAAAGAVLWHRAGEIDRTVEFAVQSLVALADSEPTDTDALAASNSLAQVFAQLSSFGAAIKMADQAFENGVALPVHVRGHYAFNLGYCAIESCIDGESDHDALDLALDAAAFIETDHESEESRLSAAGFRGEVALLRDDRPAFEALGSLLDYRQPGEPQLGEATGDRLLPWLGLVRASAALRWGDPTVAVALLDTAVPQLERLGDDHRLARAIDRRARARLAVGDHDGAVADALDLASKARVQQARQGDRLAAQILRRADIEGADGRLVSETDQLAPTAAVDVVTGARSRRWLELRLDGIARESRLLSVVMIDLDHFRHINDTFGNEIGDEVLARVGAILAEEVRSTDVVARYGGEEFIVVLEDSGVDDARDLAERIRTCLTVEPWDRLAAGLTVTASAGAAEGPSWSVRDLIRFVVGALDRARTEGHGRLVIADPERATNGARPR